MDSVGGIELAASGFDSVGFGVIALAMVASGGQRWHWRLWADSVGFGG